MTAWCKWASKHHRSLARSGNHTCPTGSAALYLLAERPRPPEFLWPCLAMHRALVVIVLQGLHTGLAASYFAQFAKFRTVQTRDAAYDSVQLLEIYLIDPDQNQVLCHSYQPWGRQLWRSAPSVPCHRQSHVDEMGGLQQRGFDPQPPASFHCDRLFWNATSGRSSTERSSAV